MAKMVRRKLPVKYAVRPVMSIARRVHSMRKIPILQVLYVGLKQTPLSSALVCVQVNGFVNKFVTVQSR